MQSLWNRASQAHRCGCRACSTAVNALGKRATTAAGRRKATFAEVFTACYSSVFASAAIIDAVRKDERRKDLDQQLDEARQELADLKEHGKSLRSRSTTEADGLSAKQMDILWKAMKQVYNERPYLKDIRLATAASPARPIDSIRRNYYNSPTETELRKGRKIDWAALEQAILDESNMYAAPGTRTETQLRHETTRFLSMIEQLLKRANRMERTKKWSPGHQEAWKLLKTNPSNFTFRSINPESAKEATQALNESLRDILASPLPPKEKIGRICYNMMVSPHVPDVHTYNTLIAGFDKRGYFELSDAVIYSFFHGRYIRPTESTFIAILNHNKALDQPAPFLLNIARITGLDSERGAKIRKRHEESMQRDFEKAWASKNRHSKTQTGDYIMEHMPLNRALVEEMLNGLLRFKLFEQAAVLFVGCLKGGVMLGGKVVRQVLDECIAALDWSASVQLLRGMSEFGQQFREMVLDGGEDGAYMINRVHVLLDLCGIDTREQGALSLAAQRVRVSPKLLSSFLDSLDGMSIVMEPPSGVHTYEANKSRMLQLESIRKEYIKVRRATVSIESKLLNADHEQEFREDCALHVAESALGQAEMLSAEFAKLTTTLMAPQPIVEEILEEEEEVPSTPSRTVERAFVPDSQRIAVAQIAGLDRGLAMHWSRQIAPRPQLMAQSLGFSSV